MTNVRKGLKRTTWIVSVASWLGLIAFFVADWLSSGYKPEVRVLILVPLVSLIPSIIIWIIWFIANWVVKGFKEECPVGEGAGRGTAMRLFRYFVWFWALLMLPLALLVGWFSNGHYSLGPLSVSLHPVVFLGWIIYFLVWGLIAIVLEIKVFRRDE